MANKAMKRCSVSLAVRDTQTKATERFQHRPVRMAAVRTVNTKCCQDAFWECRMYPTLKDS